MRSMNINVTIDGVAYKLPKYARVSNLTMRLVTENPDDTIFHAQLDTFKNEERRPYYYSDDRNIRMFFRIDNGMILCEDTGSFNGQELIRIESKEWRKENRKHTNYK